MNRDEYNVLFHKMQLNLVAFKRLMDCDEEVLALVNEAIREALAEQCVCGEPDTPGTHRTDGPCLAEQPAQQEPVTNYCKECLTYNGHHEGCSHYTTPPQRKPLTDEKNGSPCPEFWDWLPRAYNFDGDGVFTKYNMEVAFLAGKQSVATNDTSKERVDETAKREHEPEKEVTITCSCDDEFYIPLDELVKQLQEDKSQDFHKRFDTHPAPPKREWVGLTDEEIREAGHLNVEGQRMLPYSFARAVEAKLKEKNA